MKKDPKMSSKIVKLPNKKHDKLTLSKVTFEDALRGLLQTPPPKKVAKKGKR